MNRNRMGDTATQRRSSAAQRRSPASASWKDDDQTPIVSLVQDILQQAISRGASDIHIEPMAQQGRVRLRVDGVLQACGVFPPELLAPVISHIKIMGGMDTSVHGLPQDGRIAVDAPGQKVNMRVSSLPTMQGEKVVIRLLDNSSALTSVAQLGMAPEVQKVFQDLMRQPHGMILITGPTGSGKTTTVTATLWEIHEPGKNIVTLEDPVEYEIPGTNQVQINEKTGLTFAGALRAILRQDPNVIMIGELRDRETAEVAIRAALTGHLVLATVHTNDAASTFSRLLEMGIDPSLVASSVIGVVAQRLGRRLCSRCREDHFPALADPDREVFGLPREPIRLYRAAGCSECGMLGYRGRIGLFEVLKVSPAIRELITRDARPVEIHRQAISEGMVSLRQDGVRHALAGRTSLDEVQRASGCDGL